MILASTSPRRAEILEMLGLPFEVLATPVPEERRPGEAPAAYVDRLAREKALATQGRLAGSTDSGESVPWVLAGDTVVVLGDRVLEKPIDEEDAVRMLLELAGRTHHVLTGLALLDPGRRLYSHVGRSAVTFRPFDDGLARAYVATGEPMDKAGAYGIQGKGAALIESVNGDFFTVMGLSVSGLMDLFGEAGFPFHFGLEQGASPFAR